MVTLKDQCQELKRTAGGSVAQQQHLFYHAFEDHFVASKDDLASSDPIDLGARLLLTALCSPFFAPSLHHP